MLKDVQIEANIKAMSKIQADKDIMQEHKYKMYKNIASEIISLIEEVSNVDSKVNNKPIAN